MKYFNRLIFCIILIMTQTGCELELPLEDMTIILLLGVDLDEENNLRIFASSPVFSEDAKKKIEVVDVKAETIQSGRNLFDTRTSGEVTGSKIEVLLLSKRVLEHEDWFPLLDTFYRHPQFSNNTRVMMVDGSLSAVFNYEPEDKPDLPLHLKTLIDQNEKRGLTVKTTLRELHRQISDKGVTPSLSYIKSSGERQMNGTALLNKKGMYIDSLDPMETSLLLILQKELGREVTFAAISNPNKPNDSIFHKDKMSFIVAKAKTKIHTSYDQGTFKFDIKIKMPIALTERLFPFNFEKDLRGLEKIIEKEMEKQFKGIIKKFQTNKIDPIGLGLYARAFQYDQYKKVEDHWGEAFAASKVKLSVQIDIAMRGAIK
ncbi:Ger(x)C family spore germination protein [Cytobacillus sp. FJAT-53684]|uniref:Ger(X)C family spore germination protein n=1 Tax=Cytobacillus mangrovibacter TaxID=3299024 RepID=A0ABW6K2E7_9BACI